MARCADTAGKTLQASLDYIDTLQQTCSTDHSTDRCGVFGCGAFGCGGHGRPGGCGRSHGNHNISFSSSVAQDFTDHIFAIDDIGKKKLHSKLLLTLQHLTILP